MCIRDRHHPFLIISLGETPRCLIHEEKRGIGADYLYVLLEKMYSQAIIEFHVYIGAFHEDLIVIEQFQIYYKDGIFM